MELRITDLTKSYEQTKVLEDIHFTFTSGKIYALLGRNGIGKTTFFNCLNKDIDYQSGKFYLDQRELHLNDIGYVISIPVVPEFLTAQEFLEIFIEINKERIEDLQTVDYYFQLAGIKEKDRYKLLRDYSHGMKNKIQMLVNIILKPKVLLLDEPLTSLDIIAQEEMKVLLKSLKQGSILIFSTHILELALDLCDEIVVLNNKKFQLVERIEDHAVFKQSIIELLKDEKYD